jgi:IS605 OrfB family transposase
MMRAYKYRLYPTVAQQALFAKHFGHARHVYNWALHEKTQYYERTGKNLSQREIQDRLSEGDKVDNPSFLQNALLLLGKEQKKLSRKKKSSANRSKQKKRVACIHEGIAIKREAFLHEKTAELAVKNHATTFVVENLNIRGMVKNPKLARRIQDVSWGTFLRVLDYKCEWNGKNLIKIDRFFPSSKQCHACLYKADKMPLSIREWTCPVCGVNHDRDINAAINIRNKGLADSLGHSDCIKSSPVAIPVSAGATARGISI